MQIRLSNDKKQELLVGVILLILIFLPRVTNLGLFLGHDEQMRNRQSLDSFLAIAEGRWGDVYSSNFGATNLTWARAGEKLIHYAWLRARGVEVALPEMVNYGPRFNPLPGAIFNGLLLLILYCFVRKLFGWKTAALATAMLALDPYLLSEARILRTEAAYATFFTLAILSLALHAKYFQHRYLLWIAVWSAWFIATKISGIVIAPIILATLIVTFWRHRPGDKHTVKWFAKRLIIDGLILSATTLIFIIVIWPVWWKSPWQTIITYYEYLKFFAITSKSALNFFYFGKIVEDLPPFYYFLVLLYKSTPLIWLGLGAFCWNVWQRRRERKPSRWAIFSFPLAGGIIIFLAGVMFVVFMMMGAFKTERYMMSAISNFNLVAALGLATSGQSIWQRWQKQKILQSVFIASIIAGFFFLHALFTLLNHPYYFSYYNPLLGGGKTAEKILQIGSGELLDQAMDYVNDKAPSTPQLQIIVCGSNLPRCEYASIGQTILKREELLPVHSGWIGADYIIDYIFQRQRGDYPPEIIDYLENRGGEGKTIRFQGIDYAKIYPAPKAERVVASTLTGLSTLLGFSLNNKFISSGEEVRLNFYWQNDGHIDQDMFVQLTDSAHYVWAETAAPIAPDFEALRATRHAVLEGGATLPIPQGIPTGQYFLQMGYRQSDGKLIGLFEMPAGSNAISVTHTTSPKKSPPSEDSILILDEVLALTHTEIEARQVAPDDSLWLTLYWQAIEDVAADYVLNLKLIAPNGEEAAYWLGRPIRSNLPTKQWQKGDIFQDPWLLSIPADLAPGGYTLTLSVYDADTSDMILTSFLQDIQVISNAE